MKTAAAAVEEAEEEGPAVAVELELPLGAAWVVMVGGVEER